jgi:protein Mpv17
MLISAFGDVVAQKVLEGRPFFDFTRNRVVSSYGFVETIIEGHLWYGLLDRVFGSSMKLKVSLLKTACDQFAFSPTEISCFMVYTHVIEHHKDRTLYEKLAADLPATLLSSYVFWLPCSLINFYLVPLHLRALYTGSMCVLWDTFMSFASHNRLKESLSKGEVVN